jgi:hypothetical protein
LNTDGSALQIGHLWLDLYHNSMHVLQKPVCSRGITTQFAGLSKQIEHLPSSPDLKPCVTPRISQRHSGQFSFLSTAGLPHPVQ